MLFHDNGTKCANFFHCFIVRNYNSKVPFLIGYVRARKYANTFTSAKIPLKEDSVTFFFLCQRASDMYMPEFRLLKFVCKKIIVGSFLSAFTSII